MMLNEVLTTCPFNELLVGAGVWIIGKGVFKLAKRQLLASGAFGSPEIVSKRGGEVGSEREFRKRADLAIQATPRQSNVE